MRSGLEVCILCLLLVFLSSCAVLDGNLSSQGYGIDLLRSRQPRGKTCASTCLYVVARHWGISKSMRQIEAELGSIPEGGYTLRQLRDWAREEGLGAYVVKGTVQELKTQTRAGRPVILTFRQGRRGNHSVVVRGVTMSEDILAMDPRKGRYVCFRQRRLVPQWEALGCPMLVIAPLTGSTGVSKNDLSFVVVPENRQ